MIDHVQFLSIILDHSYLSVIIDHFYQSVAHTDTLFVHVLCFGKSPLQLVLLCSGNSLRWLRLLSCVLALLLHFLCFCGSPL